MSGLCVSVRPDDLAEARHDIDDAWRQPGFMKGVHHTSVCIALISLGLMTTVHPAAIAGATLIRDRAGARIPWRKYAHHAGRLHPDLRCADSFDQVEICEDFFEVQENVRREAVGALSTVLRCAVFHDRRFNELIHSLGQGVRAAAAGAPSVFLATLRKGVEGLFRQHR